MTPARPGQRSPAPARRLAAALCGLKARLLLLAALCGACAALVASDWHSPLRSVLAVAFLMLAPGWSIAELVSIVSEPLNALILALALSISLDTCVAVSLLYAHAFSLTLASAILIGLTLSASAGALLRARRAAALGAPGRARHPVEQGR